MNFTYERPEFDLSDPAEIRRVIEEAYLNGCESTHTGKPADYIPELAKANPDDFGLCVQDLTGETITFGETEKRFSIREYGVLVGIPSKSGVGGGIVASVAGRWGIGTYGPALNAKGNSAGGIAALQHMSHLLRLNTFS